MNALQLIRTAPFDRPAGPVSEQRMVDVLRRRAAAIPHPAGEAAPLAMAEAAFALWDRHLVHFPDHPDWVDRDRVVFSGAGAPALAQALLQLSGYEAPVTEATRIGRARSAGPCRLAQSAASDRGAATAGTRAVAIVRSQQALAVAVGLAIAERWLARRFHDAGASILDDAAGPIIDHRCYAFVDRSCLATSSAADACRTARDRGLDKLVVLCHDHASADGEDPMSFFARCGWNVVVPDDAGDVDAIDAALHEAAASSGRPSAVVCRGARRTDASIGEAASDASRAQTSDSSIDAAVRAAWHAGERGAQRHRAWQRRFGAWQRRHPALAAEFDRRMRGDLPPAWHASVVARLSASACRAKPSSTRDASADVVSSLGACAPEMQPLSIDSPCLPAVMNGIALHGGFIVHGEHRADLDDEQRNALRMAVRQRRPLVHLFDQETSTEGIEPVDGLDVWQPCDAAEATAACATALAERSRPSAVLVDDDERVPHPRTAEQMLAIARGGYVLSDRPDPVAVLVASGAAVHRALDAQRRFDSRGVPVRVVSLPSKTVFERQGDAWRQQVLPAGVAQRFVHVGSNPDTMLERLPVAALATRAA